MAVILQAECPVRLNGPISSRLNGPEKLKQVADQSGGGGGGPSLVGASQKPGAIAGVPDDT